MPLTNITKHIVPTITICNVITISGNVFHQAYCHNCLGNVKANKLYRKVEGLVDSNAALRCYRCNACTIPYLFAEYGLSPQRIENAMKEGKAIDLRDSNIKLTLT